MKKHSKYKLYEHVVYGGAQVKKKSTIFVFNIIGNEQFL